jgi:hypothetical protein
MKRKESAFVVAQAAIFVVVIALVALPAQSTSQQQVSTSQTSETVQGSALGSNGLQLSASLNASQLTPSQTLQVNVSLFNTLPTINNLTRSDDWPFQGIPLALWPDCYVWYALNANMSTTAEAVVLKGDYTMANISSVADVYFPLVGCMEGIVVNYALFGPSSAQANLTGLCGCGPLTMNTAVGPYHAGNTFTTTGYWNPLKNSDPPRTSNVFLDYGQQQAGLRPTTTAFTPGVCTVGIEDMWGQAVILHFVEV